MALDRQTIEKKDFPMVKRGYDPAAVDAHLSTVAAEVETHAPERSPEPVASAISEQVRGIVEAAERAAAEIQAQAEREARELRAEAVQRAELERQQSTEGARREREQAAVQAREHVGRVSQATTQMLARLESIGGELDALTASLRTGTDRLKGELERLERELGEVRAATGSGVGLATSPAWEEPAVAPEPVESAPVATDTEAAAAVAEPVPAAESAKFGDAPPEEVEEPARVSEPAPAAAGEPAGADDSEGARLIALNMALNGTPRAEADRYLAENFQLHDRQTLLDEVYSSIEG